MAGPNGAGKTTCVQKEPIREILPHVQFLNPDDRTKELLIAEGFSGFADAPEEDQRRCFATAATQVEESLLTSIRRGESVGVETVLSTDKYRKIVELVRSLGGSVCLIYITLAEPAIAIQRVANRVARGGHNVPSDKVIERFARSHTNLTWFAMNADHFWVIDNSSSDLAIPPVMRAFGGGGKPQYLDSDSTELLKDALGSLPRE